MTYWVTFEDGYSGSVDTFGAPDMTYSEAQDYWTKYLNRLFEYSLVKDHGKVVKVVSLPYPGNPRLVSVSYHKHGATPSFCMHPSQCAGRTSCPRRYSCVD